MKLNDVILERLTRRCGADVSTPYGCNILALDVEKVTGERLSVNTLKRLSGVLHYPGRPRVQTLRILADYLGIGNWKTLCSRRAAKIKIRIPCNPGSWICIIWTLEF